MAHAFHRQRAAFAYVARHPVRFAVGVLRAFRANQGLLLAGAVAYYALLSLVPLLILMLIALARIVDQDQLLGTLAEYERLGHARANARITGMHTSAANGQTPGSP